MKKALVIGGSNGIGLAITKNLIKRGFYIDILDRRGPESGVLPEDCFSYHYCDLLDLNEELINSFATDKSIELLMITAGFGRVADFEYFHIAEIKNIMTVNATATIQILRIFYDRIKNTEKFYCGVMGSISGLMSSPMAAVYAASKAAICRFIESVNIELEFAETGNRILNVSPASFKGSRFNGGQNQLELLKEFAEEIVQHLLSSDCLYIPQYKETFKAVLERYHNDAHEYGIHSYKYKKASDRVMNEKRVIIGYLSGTFDLFHVGHLNLLQIAKQQCDYLIVGVHDGSIWENKEIIIPFEERKQMISGCKYVDKVVDAEEEDTDAWNKLHFDVLFVGSHYQGTERLKIYESFFDRKKVRIVNLTNTFATTSTQIH